MLKWRWFVLKVQDFEEIWILFFISSDSLCNLGANCSKTYSTQVSYSV